MDFRNPNRHELARLHMRLINLRDAQHAEVKDLLAAGARLDLYGEIDGMLPLHHAAKNGQAKVVAAIIGAGGRLESRGGVKATPLHLAAAHGHVQACRVLLEAGANRRALDGKKRTPMICGAQAGHGEAVRLFLGEPDAKVSQQELAEVLKALARTSEPKYVQEVLDRMGVTPELVNVGFYTAVAGGNLEVSKHLVEQGADWANPPGGRSLLQLAKRDAHELKRYLRSLRTSATLDTAMDEESESSLTPPASAGPSPL